jgi:hypothetical protein
MQYAFVIIVIPKTVTLFLAQFHYARYIQLFWKNCAN